MTETETSYVPPDSKATDRKNPGDNDDGAEPDDSHDGADHRADQLPGTGLAAASSPAMTSAPQNGQDQGREGPLNTTAKWVLRIAATLVLLWIAGIAIWLGSQDVLWPVSFTAQILGDFFIVAGLTTLAGAVLNGLALKLSVVM
jgi:hypothetical protein